MIKSIKAILAQDKENYSTNLLSDHFGLYNYT